MAVDDPDELASSHLDRRIAALASAVRFGRFLSVGAVGALCDNAVLVALVEVAGLDPVAGGVLSKEASIALMFVLNEVWTFSEVD